MGTSIHADAQFWKNWFKKEQPKKKPVHKTAPSSNTTKNKPVAKKDKHIDYPPTIKKTRYRIDVLVPLYLDELVKNGKPAFKDRLPDKAVAGINFYEGLQLAADTLDKSFYKIDVYVHDIADAKQTSQQLISSKELDSSDLIIGAVPATDIAPIAQYADKRKINFVSALSPSDASIKDNPYFTLLQPTLQTNCEWLRKTVLKKYPGHNKILVFERNTSSVDVNAYKYFVGDDEKAFEKVNVNTFPAKENLRRVLDSTATNVVVMPVLDNAYAESVLAQLYRYFPEYNFEVYGMPTWRAMASLKKADAYPNIAVYFTAPYYFDYSTQSGQMISSRYKNAFGGKPSEYVFRGYEVFSWYAYLLTKYGTIFNTHTADNAAAIFTRYDIKQRWDENNNLLYNENQHLYFYRYQSGSYMVEQ